MVTERYWDVTGCCWKPCRPHDPGASPSSGIDADVVAPGVPSPAAVPTSTGPVATGADPVPPEAAGPAEV